MKFRFGMLATAAIALVLGIGILVNPLHHVLAQLSTSTTPRLGLNNGFGAGALVNNNALNTNFTTLDGVVPLFYASATSAGIAAPTTAATCTSGTVAVTGATTAMTAVASPTSFSGATATWSAYVSAANTVTIVTCATAATSAQSPTYAVKVFN